jgi:phosphatidylserine decarboxylase
MTIRTLIEKISQWEQLNFLLTNRIPRRLATRFMGWFSQIQTPWVRDSSIWLWRLFCDVDLSDAQRTSFRSLHDAFTRELREGARVVDRDPQIVVSPCDAIIGACGRVEGTRVFQIKGSPYAIEDLIGQSPLIDDCRNGSYVTLRLTAGMYHRFHAPFDGRVDEVTYISGDTWNVNPPALKRIEKLFCKNERALIPMRLPTGHTLTLVPVAAILVASIRLHFLDVLLNLKYRGPNRIPCATPFEKGQEMGWFEHGSTIIVFAPDGFSPCENIHEGARIRMGEPLLRLPTCSPAECKAASTRR